MQVFDSRLSKCPACNVTRLRPKEKQLIARNVEDILQKQDAAGHLELMESESAMYENIKDINAQFLQQSDVATKIRKKVWKKSSSKKRTSFGIQ